MASIEPWVGSELAPKAGIIDLSNDCLEELTIILKTLRANPMPLLALSPSDMSLPHLSSLSRKIRKILDEGLGFCILNKLPISDMNEREVTTIYWLLAQLVGRPVAQKWSDGRMIYSVTDLGRPSGNGVRPDVTNEDQSFHTDNSYNISPPDHVGLLCLYPAAEGGLNRIVNMVAVLEVMNKQFPHLVSRLYQPYFFDRQREHSDTDEKTIYKPPLSYEDGHLRVRVSRNLIYQGYKLAGEVIDETSEAVLDAFFSIIDNPKMYIEFQFESGQIQFLNNRLMGHKRTGFLDSPDTAMKRHLLRIWLRKKGSRFYNG
jgi:alpha-ketoglutarate-dependent taurine dioxygenase